MIEVEGPIAFIGKPTEDGRLIRELDVARLPVPVFFFGDPDDPDCEWDGLSRAAGTVDVVQIQSDGAVWASCRLYGGEEFGDRRPVGIDVDSISAVYTRNGEVPDPEAIHDGLMMSGEIVEDIVSGRLVGVTVYFGDEKPAWPDAYLHRKISV